MSNKIVYPDAETMANALKKLDVSELYIAVICEEKPIQYGYGEHKTFINHDFETVIVTAEVNGKIHEARFRILVLNQFDRHDESKFKERLALANQREIEIKKYFQDEGFTLKSGRICSCSENINSFFQFTK
jgi:hypothetical protein